MGGVPRISFGNFSNVEVCASSKGSVAFRLVTRFVKLSIGSWRDFHAGIWMLHSDGSELFPRLLRFSTKLTDDCSFPDFRMAFFTIEGGRIIVAGVLDLRQDKETIWRRLGGEFPEFSSSRLPGGVPLIQSSLIRGDTIVGLQKFQRLPDQIK